MASTIPNTDLLSFLFDHAKVPEDQKIFANHASDSEFLTKGDVRRLTRQLVAGWRNQCHAEPGFSVCVHAFNSIYYPLMFYGIVGAGGRFAGSNPAYTATELAHHLRTSQASFIITEPEQVQQVLAAAAECSIPQHNIFVLDQGDKTSARLCSWKALLNHGEEDWVRFDDSVRCRETAAGLFSTSGTTGLPKMAVRTHYNFVAECVALADKQPKPYEVVRLLSIPFFHAFAAPLAMTTSLYNGYTTVVMKRFQQAHFSSAIKRFNVTETAVVPPIIFKWLSATEPQSYPSLKAVYCGGAPLDSASQSKVLSFFADDARLVQVWGMTEAGWITTFRYPDRDDSGSVGELLPTFEARVIDEHGSVLGNGEKGEIQVRGGFIMHSYFNNEEATRKTINEDGWLSTGDVAQIRDGKVYIVDRIKDLIKVRGWQVSPSEIEGVLYLHEDIVDAAVIGVPSADGSTEIPRAYVITNKDLKQAHIRNFLLRRLAKYKVGECEIVFTDSIPKSPSGKILKKDLRASASSQAQVEAIVKAVVSDIAIKPEAASKVNAVVTEVPQTPDLSAQTAMAQVASLEASLDQTSPSWSQAGLGSNAPQKRKRLSLASLKEGRSKMFAMMKLPWIRPRRRLVGMVQ